DGVQWGHEHTGEIRMQPQRFRGKKPGRVARPDRPLRVTPAFIDGAKVARDTEQLIVAANQHIVSHYPIGCLAGTPRRLALDDRELWIVPIVLTSPGYGAVGDVGFVAIDPHELQPVGSTPRAEVVAAARRLREEKHE